MTLDDAVAEATKRRDVGAGDDVDTFVIDTLGLAQECGFTTPTAVMHQTSSAREYKIEISPESTGLYIVDDARAFFVAGLRACDKADELNGAKR